MSLKDKNIENSRNIPAGILLSIPEMKLYETTWVQVKRWDYHQCNLIKDEGCYFELYIENIEYINTDNYEQKLKVIEERR